MISQSIDADSSGYLDRSELTDMMRHLGIGFKDLEQDIDSIFGEQNMTVRRVRSPSDTLTLCQIR